MKKPFKSKKTFKQISRKCCICEEKDYDLLDTHRWRIQGSKGGKYSNSNCLCLCVKCHRLLHRDRIKIIGVYNSTVGKVIEYMDINNKKQMKKI